MIEFMGIARGCAGRLGPPAGSPGPGGAFRFVAGPGERGRSWVLIDCSAENMSTLIGSQNEVTPKKDVPSSFSLRSPRARWCRDAERPRGIARPRGQGVGAKVRDTGRNMADVPRSDVLPCLVQTRGRTVPRSCDLPWAPRLFALGALNLSSVMQLDNAGQISFWPATG